MQCNHLRLFSLGDNIFVDSTGEWFLGDFGSCRRRDDEIRTTTEVFFYESLRGKKAEPKIDFFMLLVVVVIEALPNKHDFVKELIMDGHVNRRLLDLRILQINHENLAVLISDLRRLAEFL
jgi:hypothetical protein